MGEAKALASYVHFRPPTSVACLRALARTDGQFYTNFLDPVKEDLPKGCWGVRQDPSVSLVTLRSLMWPGYSPITFQDLINLVGFTSATGRRTETYPSSCD